MGKTIVINLSNYLQGSGNKYVNNFPQTSYFAAGSRIGVSNISIYNSVQNITQKRGNNVVTLNWLGTDNIFTFPDGYYSVSDINFFFQNQCILNGLCVTANSGADNVCFFELVINSIRYATSLNFYAIPTDAQAINLKYSKPSNATWSYPVSPTTPSLTFGQSFGNLIGQTFGKYPPITQSSNIQYLSTSTPVISPVDSLILTCNLVNSKYSVSNNILFSVAITTALGTIIQPSISSIVFNDILPQNFSTLEITIFDQPLCIIRQRINPYFSHSRREIKYTYIL
jgi:hypothetical protein